MSAERYSVDGRAIISSLTFGGTTIIGDITGENSIITPAWIMVHPELSSNAKVLFGYMKAALIGVLPIPDTSHRSFADAMNVDPRTVRRYVKELKDVGAVFVQESFKDSKQQTNVYYLWPHKPQVGGTNLSGGTQMSTPPDTDVHPYNNININNTMSPKGEVKKSRKTKVYTPEFDALWILYPRKENKPGAFEAYNGRIRDDKIPYEVLLQATKNYALLRAKEDPRFTLQAKTFYGPNRRFEDYLGKEEVLVLTPEQEICAEIYEDWDNFGSWMMENGEVILANPIKSGYTRPTNEKGEPIDINGRPYKIDNQGKRQSIEFFTN